MRTLPQNLAESHATAILLVVTRFETCDSTNRALLAAAEAGAPAGSVFVARAQTAGRGRRGRAWLVEPGCTLAFSMLWTFPVDPAALSGLSLAVGVGIQRALTDPALGALKPGFRTGLKWPNDILVRRPDGSDAKAGGILIESVLRRTVQGEREMAVVIGVGLNCLPSAAIEAAVMDQPIVALADIYATPERLQPEALLPIVLRALQQTLRQFAVGGFAALRDAWLAAHLWQGAAVRISEAGTAVLDGELRGVDTDGALCIATPAGMERVITGDVSLRKV